MAGAVDESLHAATKRTASGSAKNFFIYYSKIVKGERLLMPNSLFDGQAVSELRSLALRTGLATGVPLS